MEKLLELNPASSKAHFNLGLAYASKNMVESAISEFRKTVSSDPENIGARYNLAYAYEEKDMIDEAVAEYKKAMDVNYREQGKTIETANKQKEPENVIVTFDKHEN